MCMVKVRMFSLPITLENSSRAHSFFLAKEKEEMRSLPPNMVGKYWLLMAAKWVEAKPCN